MGNELSVFAQDAAQGDHQGGFLQILRSLVWGFKDYFKRTRLECRRRAQHTLGAVGYRNRQ